MMVTLMFGKLYAQILKKSPWDDFQNEENIFTKKRKQSFKIEDFEFNFNGKYLALALGVLVALWLSSGFYQVSEGEQAIVIRLGKYNRTSMPGLNYHIPAPIEKIEKEKVDQSRRVEIGYRSTGAARIGGATSSREMKSESIMLTGDENIIDITVDVMWHINDLSKYIFNVVDQQDTVKSAAESAIREVIGNTPISSVLSNQKQLIAEKIESLVQQILNQYDSGVEIEQVKLLKAEPPQEVIAAYRDVQTAKADKEKAINESEAYQNDILPKARGQAAKLIEESEGYKAEIIGKANGDSARFNYLYKQYIQHKDITKTRLHIEAVETVLKNANKTIMGSESVLPHMSVNTKKLID